MEPMWFYMEGQIQRGPLSTQDLIAALITVPEPRRAPVWREGLANWERAGALPELSSKLPPQVQFNTARPDSRSPATPDEEEEFDVALRYRRLVLLVGVQLVSQLPRLFVEDPPSDLQMIVVLVGMVSGFVASIVAAVTAYQLSRDLNSGMPILWAIGMFVPLINILLLLAISSRAQNWCKERGIPVGFLGPKI